VTANGYGKRTPLTEYRITGRGGRGIRNIQPSDRNGPVVGITHVTDDNQVLIITKDGMVIRMAVAPLRPIGRNTQGVRLIRLEEGDRVEALARLDIAEVAADPSDVVAPLETEGAVEEPLDEPEEDVTPDDDPDEV
jgi:DNA gyrase subunit A